MKSSDLKVVAIILSIALFFTIITSNAVSIASVVILAKGGTAAPAQQQQGTDVNQQQQSNNNVNTNTNTDVNTNTNTNEHETSQENTTNDEVSEKTTEL